MEFVKLPQNYTTTKVISTSFEYDVPTYDIEVNNTHYYKLNNGIISHNTLSLQFSDTVLSYGIEPAFGLYYWKRTKITGKFEYYFIVPKIVRDVFEQHGYKIPIETDTIKDTWDGKFGKPIAKFIDEHKDKLGIKFKKATEITPMDKLHLMANVQENIDSSISTTYMLPEDTSIEYLKEFILKAHELEVKSIAAFPDRKMYGIISYIPFRQLAFELTESGMTLYKDNFTDDELKQLNISTESIKPSVNAPKRPKVLPADVYSITIKGEKFCVAVGLLNGKPYEIFCGHMDGLNFKFKESKGTIEKIKRGQYKLEIGELVVENFSDSFHEVEKALFRMVSTSLRHGTPIKFIVEQLSKSADDMFSITAAASRVLKKYITDGEKATGQTCPTCGNKELIYSDGCVSCPTCGWSKCS